MAVWVDCTSGGGFRIGGFAAYLGDWIGEWPQGWPVVLDGLQDGDKVEFWIALEDPAHPGDPLHLADGSYGTPVWTTITTAPTPGDAPTKGTRLYGTGGAPYPAAGEPPSPAGDWKFWIAVYKWDAVGEVWVAPPYPPEHYVPADYAAAGTAGPSPWHWSAWQPGYEARVMDTGYEFSTNWSPLVQHDGSPLFNSDLNATAETFWYGLVAETTMQVPGYGLMSGAMFGWSGSNYVPGPAPPSGWAATLEAYQAALQFQLPPPPAPTLPDGVSSVGAPFHASFWQWDTSPVGQPGVADYTWESVPFQVIGYDTSNQSRPHGFDQVPTALWECWCYDDSRDPGERSMASDSHVGPDGQVPVARVAVSQSDHLAFPFPYPGGQYVADLTGVGLPPTFSIAAGIHESFTGTFPSDACPGIGFPGGEDSWWIWFAYAETDPATETTREAVAYALIQTCRWRYWVGPELRTGGGPFWTPGEVQVYGKPAGEMIIVERNAEPIGDMLAP
jgi:hypothetical protein